MFRKTVLDIFLSPLRIEKRALHFKRPKTHHDTRTSEPHNTRNLRALGSISCTKNEKIDRLLLGSETLAFWNRMGGKREPAS